MFNLHHINTTLAGKWGMQLKMFHQMNWMIDGLNAKVQPVFVNDVALAAINCLKMEETIGQTYELGGPHVYNYEELY
jgi:nucleoside-diphosphate-sugar epimerase